MPMNSLNFGPELFVSKRYHGINAHRAMRWDVARKQILRSQAPRTESELLLATKAAFHAISTADCESFFFNAKCAI